VQVEFSCSATSLQPPTMPSFSNLIVMMGVVAFLCSALLVTYSNIQIRESESEQLQLLREILSEATPVCNCPATSPSVCTCNCFGGSENGGLQNTNEPDWMREDLKKRSAFFGSIHDEIPEALIPVGKLPEPSNINGDYQPLGKKVDLSKYKRKVFLDLGGRDGDSAQWFLDTYPHADQFEIWVFEADHRFNDVHKGKPWKYFNLAVWIKNGTVELGDAKMGSSIVVQSQPNKTKVASFDFTEFLATHFSYDDFVVCKMDIEGAELSVVPKMLATLTAFLLDEFMLECHYYEWTGLFPNIRRKDCVLMIQELRDLKMYVHEWN